MKKKTLKTQREQLEKKLLDLKRKQYEAREKIHTALRELNEKCKEFKKTHSIPINGHIIKDTEQDGTQVELEWTDLYLVEGEEWVTSKRTTVRISDMLRDKSCFRREGPGENWDHHL